ncbi:guanine nucleotide-binding protein-like 3-like protein [Cuculus canorus]|uniref:guanine nucleotide-binding protein-like 3-like protein n=1 Tax=Cuculus canorus TaxID=55661 RepID=UPI0023AA39F6|nr:guanine nucleotide-binding protein-like 3-like protein [Cuculus canorus]
MTRSRRQVEAARKKRLQGKGTRKKAPALPQLSSFAAHIRQRAENKRKKAAEAQQRQQEARQAELGARRQRQTLRQQRGTSGSREVTAQPEEASLQHCSRDLLKEEEEASLRQYGRELRKVLDAADVVLEVLDARDPQGSRSAQLEAAVRSAGPRQRLVLVLNKIDLVPRDVVTSWLKALRAEFPTVAFKACTQRQSHRLKQSRVPAGGAPGGLLAGGGSVGAAALLRLLAASSRAGTARTTVTVGVVGHPNVGKSSLINSLKRSRACRVGAIPGVTRSVQAVQIGRHIRLLDSPGVVMETGPSSLLPLRGALNPQTLRDPLSPAAAIVQRCPPEQLQSVFGVPPCPEDPLRFLSLLALRRGRLRAGGVPDSRAAALELLRRWSRGDISYYTRPPKTSGVHLESHIVPELSAPLDLDALDRGDIPVPEVLVEEEEEEEEEFGGAECDLEVQLRARPPPGEFGGSPVPRDPALAAVPALPPLFQGHGLRAAGRRRRRLRRRAEKLAAKLSQSLESTLRL